MDDLTGVRFSAEEVGGTRVECAPVAVPGAPGQLALALDACDATRLVQDLMKGPPGAGPDAGRPALRRVGLETGIELIRPLAPAYLADAARPFDARARFCSALTPLLVADLRCLRDGLPPACDVLTIVAPFVAWSAAPFLPTSSTALVVRREFPLPGPGFLPTDLAAGERTKRLDAARAMWPTLEEPRTSWEDGFECPATLLDGARDVQVLADVHQFYPTYWLEVTLNGTLRFPLSRFRTEANPDAALGRALWGESKSLFVLCHEMFVRLPAEALRPGANRIGFVLHATGPAEWLPTTLHRYEIRIR